MLEELTVPDWVITLGRLTRRYVRQSTEVGHRPSRNGHTRNGSNGRASATAPSQVDESGVSPEMDISAVTPYGTGVPGAIAMHPSPPDPHPVVEEHPSEPPVIEASVEGVAAPVIAEVSPQVHAEPNDRLDLQGTDEEVVAIEPQRSDVTQAFTASDDVPAVPESTAESRERTVADTTRQEVSDLPMAAHLAATDAESAAAFEGIPAHDVAESVLHPSGHALSSLAIADAVLDQESAPHDAPSGDLLTLDASTPQEQAVVQVDPTADAAPAEATSVQPPETADPTAPAPEIESITAASEAAAAVVGESTPDAAPALGAEAFAEPERPAPAAEPAVSGAAPAVAPAVAAKPAPKPVATGASTVLAPARQDEYNRIGLDFRRRLPRPKVVGDVIDFHCHLLAAHHAAPWFEAANHYGLDRFLTMSPLEEAVALQRTRWGHRIKFIAVPRWGDTGVRWADEWRTRIEGFYNLGSRINKFHAAPGTMAMRGKWLDDPAFRPIFRDVVDRGMAIMTHIGDPDTWYANQYADAARYGTREQHYQMWENLLEEYRGVPWIGAHMGGNPENLPRLQVLLDRFPDLMLDCSATRWMQREISARRDAARDFFIRNQDRILFGSDQVSFNDRGYDFLASRFWVHRKLWETAYVGPSPIVDPDVTADQQPPVRGLALPDVVLQKLYHDNAARLLQKIGMAF